MNSEKLQNLINVTNSALEKVISTESITDTQILSGQTIDFGKMEEMHSICSSIIEDAENTINSCHNYIGKLNEYLNSLYEQRNQMGGNW